MTSKTEQVKSIFEDPDRYLKGRQLDIRLRIDAVQEFTKNAAFDNVLDIGCGDGSISLPLLPRCKRLTLLDIATNMLAFARKKIPCERASDVEIISNSLLRATLGSQSFDLILCVGVLAHVDSPAATIAELARIARPGASIILEFTDSYHFWGWPNVLYHQLLKVIRPAPYALNRLRNQYVMKLCRESGLTPSAVYRYGLPPLGVNKIASQTTMYRVTRFMFGPSHRNQNQWLANQFVYHLRKTQL